MSPDDEVLAERDSETATARRTVGAQLSRDVEDGVLWRRDVFSYSSRRVTREPRLCQKQYVQPAIDDLIVYSSAALWTAERQLRMPMFTFTIS